MAYGLNMVAVFHWICSDLSDTCYTITTRAITEILDSIDPILKTLWTKIDTANLLGILLLLLVVTDFSLYCKSLF